MRETEPTPIGPGRDGGDDLLARVVEALEALRGPPPSAGLRLDGRMHRFDGRSGGFVAAGSVAPALDLLVGVDRQKNALLALFARFAVGVSTNHALLWGARGTGKSSLVKAVVADVGEAHPQLKLVEVAADDLHHLPDLFARLDGRAERVAILCDDLSFEEGAAGAKALKSILEGGVSGPPDNVLIVATSNRRHLMPRTHEGGGDALAEAEDAEESLSMSDRFGLWLGFPPMDQTVFLLAVHAYAGRYDLKVPDLDRRALQWAARRGARSGRVAVQFIRDLAGDLGRPRPV